MFTDEIAVISKEVAELENELNSPDLVNDIDNFSLLNQKYKKKSQLLEAYTNIHDKNSELEESKSLLDDPELGEMAELDVQKLEESLAKLEAELEILTAVELEDDEKKCLIEFRAGTGGVEASLFTEDVYRMYLRYLENKNYKTEFISTNYHEEGGLKEAIISVNTPNSYGELRFESGVHRVQRVPSTESSGRIHTSAMSVTVIPQVNHKKIEIPENEIRIDVYRSSGPGGQSVNTTDSAVRITHLPTGIIVSCQDGKSQHKNKEKALSVLMTKLAEMEKEKQRELKDGIRSESIGSGDRSAKIRTYNFPQGRITDHRTKDTWYNLDSALNGEIDEIVLTVNTKIRKYFINEEDN